MICFGTIPSRRLGKSLGINNITSGKECTYSCIYCQIGITKRTRSCRREYYDPELICAEVKKQLGKLDGKDYPDYLTFVSNGEPTLDINLGRAINGLKQFNIPVAVITNASLLYDEQVRSDLNLADWVSVKVDAPDIKTWRMMNNPDGELNFTNYLKGLIFFSSGYKGKLMTETMMIKGVNDNPEIIGQIAGLISRINPSVAYISIPTRPPAISTVIAPDEERINEAYQIFIESGLQTKLILGFEGTNTGYTGNAVEDIINISSVHPIREDTMMELLSKDKADITVLNSLIRGNIIRKTEYKSRVFYIRQFHV